MCNMPKIKVHFENHFEKEDKIVIMNSLTEEQKYEVRKEIESVLRKKTREVLDEVEKKCPFANRHQISGVLSGMNTNKIIKCDEQKYSYFMGDE